MTFRYRRRWNKVTIIIRLILILMGIAAGLVGALSVIEAIIIIGAIITITPLILGLIDDLVRGDWWILFVSAPLISLIMFFFLFGLSLDMGEVAQLLGITELMLTVAGGVIALMWMFFVVPPWE